MLGRYSTSITYEDLYPNSMSGNVGVADSVKTLVAKMEKKERKQKASKKVEGETEKETPKETPKETSKTVRGDGTPSERKVTVTFKQKDAVPSWETKEEAEKANPGKDLKKLSRKSNGATITRWYVKKERKVQAKRAKRETSNESVETLKKLLEMLHKNMPSNKRALQPQEGHEGESDE
jgi:hypothetical protein